MARSWTLVPDNLCFPFPIFKAIFHHQNKWQEVAQLIPSDAHPSMLFSYGAVTIYEDTIAIGAVDANNRRGAVYLFQRVGGQKWVEIAKLVDFAGKPHSRFGYSLKLWKNTLAVGHDINGTSGIRGGGRVHIFERRENQWYTSQLLKLRIIKNRNNISYGY